MTWVKLDDQWPNHPKMLTVGPLAQLLHVRALCYCAQYLTDGAIPTAAVVSLVDWRGPGIRECCSEDGDDRGTVDVDNVALAERLVAVGSWETTATGYMIHDYLEYQRSRYQVLEERGAWTKRQKQKRTAVTGGVTGSVTALSRRDSENVTALSRRDSENVTALSRACHAGPGPGPGPGPDPDPKPEPDPDQIQRERSARACAKASPISRPETRLPDDWSPTPEHAALAARLCVDLDRESVAFRGHAESKDRRTKSWNGAFKTWLAKSRPSRESIAAAPASPCREPFMVVGALPPRRPQKRATTEPGASVGHPASPPRPGSLEELFSRPLRSAGTILAPDPDPDLLDPSRSYTLLDPSRSLAGEDQSRGECEGRGERGTIAETTTEATADSMWQNAPDSMGQNAPEAK